jgi:hypothetical protein
MTKKNFEEDCGYQLTDEEFKKIITHGNITKTIDNKNVDIKLQITDESNPFSDFADFIIDKCQGVHDIFVTNFMVNNVDILSEYDGEMSAHDCAMYLIDFIQFNDVNHLAITFPPNTIQDIMNK